MLRKTEAIVLRTIKYGDGKVIVDMFTLTEGRLSAIASCPKSARGRTRRQLFQPLSMLEVEIDLGGASSLKKLRGATTSVAYTSIPLRAEKMAIGMFLAEFLVYALRGEQANEAMFRWMADSLAWLDTCGGSCANFHIVFMMRMSPFLGFSPNMEGYAGGSVFDLRAGSFSQSPPPHDDYLRAEEAGKMAALMRMTYNNMHLFRMSREERNRLLDVIIYYYRLHIPDFPQMRSIEVLRDLFG